MRLYVYVYVSTLAHMQLILRGHVWLPLGASVIVVPQRETKTNTDVRSLHPNRLLHFTLVHARSVGVEMRVKLIK